MNASAEALTAFIREFKLRKTDGIVAFPATVQMYTNGKVQVIQSEVQVISSDHLDSLYLLSPDDDLAIIPEMFEAKHYSMDYLPGKCLVINSKDDEPVFSLRIIPNGR